MLGPVGSTNAAAGPADARAAEKAKLKQACQDFESVMMGIVYKKMHETSTGGDALDKGAANQTWRDMLADERVKSMSQAGGIGLAESLYRDLETRI